MPDTTAADEMQHLAPPTAALLPRAQRSLQPSQLLAACPSARNRACCERVPARSGDLRPDDPYGDLLTALFGIGDDLRLALRTREAYSFG